MASQTAPNVGLGPYGDFFGSLPDSFGYRRSQLNPAANANPVMGTNAYGAPGIGQPQSSNIALPTQTNPVALASTQVSSGPFSQPAFIALVSMVIGVVFLAVVSHVEVR